MRLIRRARSESEGEQGHTANDEKKKGQRVMGRGEQGHTVNDKKKRNE